MLSSIVKDHCSYGYITRLLRQKKLFGEIVWYFIGDVYAINRTLHGRSGDT